MSRKYKFHNHDEKYKVFYFAGLVTGAPRWAVTAVNAFGQVTAVDYGASLKGIFGYDTYGNPTYRQGKVGSTFKQNYWTSVTSATGNLAWRNDSIRHKKEYFAYDSGLDRLMTVTGPQNLTMNYAANGNFSQKSDVGSVYTYGTAGKPYQLTGIETSTGLVSDVEQNIVYTSFEQPSTITETPYQALFTYNAGGERAKMEVKQSGATIKTRWYAGSRYIKETTGGVTKEFTWIGGDAYSAPCLAVTQSGATTYYYLLRDHLGTITHVTDASGNVVNEYSFDAWGRRRNFTDWSYTVAAQTDILPDRGFTGHEYLPWFKLYNMNGRLYDPVVGRFLEPDPIIQDAFSTQNLNRYSYALNNPLKFTDPSGNSFKQTMDDWYGEGSYWYRGDAPGTWGNGSGPISGGGPGSGWNGPGLNGMYYDWETNSYRSTTFGNDEVGWGNAYNLASKAGASTSSPGAIESILGSIVNGDFNFGTYNAFGRNHIVIWPYGQKLNVGYALNGGLTSTNGTVFLGSNVAASVGSGNHWLGKVLNYSGKANDGLASTIGIREVFEWEYKRQAKLNRALSGNYSQTVTHSMRAIKAVGKFTGVASMGIAWADYANNNTTGNFIQALANTGLVFARVNPITGIIIGVADVTGASDYVYDQIGGLIDNY